MSCPLKTADSLLHNFSVDFKEEIREVCSFAKSIPGFKCIPHKDQVILLKAAVFEVNVIKMSVLVHTDTFTYTDREVLDESGRILISNIGQIKQKISQLGLSEAETGLFCSVVIVAPDRTNLSSCHVLKKMQSSLKIILWNSLILSHSNPQVVFYQLMDIAKELGSLSNRHSQIVFRKKSKIRTKIHSNLKSSPGEYQGCHSGIKVIHEQSKNHHNSAAMSSPKAAKESTQDTTTYIEDRYPLLKRALEQPTGSVPLDNLSEPTIIKPEPIDLIVRSLEAKCRKGEDIDFIMRTQEAKSLKREAIDLIMKQHEANSLKREAIDLIISPPEAKSLKREAIDLIVRPHKKFRHGERREETSFVSQYQQQFAKSQPLSYRCH